MNDGQYKLATMIDGDVGVLVKTLERRADRPHRVALMLPAAPAADGAVGLALTTDQALALADALAESAYRNGHSCDCESCEENRDAIGIPRIAGGKPVH